MAHHVTLADVKNTFAILKDAAANAGVDSSNWALKIGSSTYGNTFAVVNRDPATGGQSTIRSFGFTRADAYIGITAMTEAFLLVASARMS